MSGKYNNNLNRSYDAQNWNSMPAMNNTVKNRESTNSLTNNNMVIDDNTNDPKLIENYLLTFNLQKQEVLNGNGSFLSFFCLSRWRMN